MAHFAKIENNVVTEVIVIDNSDCGGGDFPQSEPIGQNFIASIGLLGTWKQTSYNSNFRKMYAGKGYIFDKDNDVFIAPQTYASWELDENFDWQSPVPMPEEGVWEWNEKDLIWQEVSNNLQ
jgi:hypothetical protein